DMAMFPYMVNPGMFPKTMYHAMHSAVPPPASSYMRSSSRSHSPSNGLPSLPPPGVGGLFLSGPGRLSPSGLPAIPTVEELQHHHRELELQRRGILEMLERTDRLLEGVRRGIENVSGTAAAAAAPAPAPSTPPQQPQQPASPS